MAYYNLEKSLYEPKFKNLKQDNLGVKHDFGGWEIEIAKIAWDQNFLLWSQFASKENDFNQFLFQNKKNCDNQLK